MNPPRRAGQGPPRELRSSGVDVPALHAALDVARQELDLSWRALATELGLVASTLSRMRDGKHPDLASFAKMTNWLGVPAETFYAWRDGRP